MKSNHAVIVHVPTPIEERTDVKKLQFPKTVDSNWMHWFGFRNHDPVFCICMEVPSGCLRENMDTRISGE